MPKLSRVNTCHPDRKHHAKGLCEPCYTKQPWFRAERAKLQRQRMKALRQEVIDHYGNKCSCPNCGEERFEFLCLDHVNGGGSQERRQYNLWQIYLKVKRLGFPDTYRILCQNCNSSFGHYGYCPHQWETPPFTFGLMDRANA
jgi:hypothetical protein